MPSAPSLSPVAHGVQPPPWVCPLWGPSLTAAAPPGPAFCSLAPHLIHTQGRWLGAGGIPRLVEVRTAGGSWGVEPGSPLLKGRPAGVLRSIRCPQFLSDAPAGQDSCGCPLLPLQLPSCTSSTQPWPCALALATLPAPSALLETQELSPARSLSACSGLLWCSLGCPPAASPGEAALHCCPARPPISHCVRCPLPSQSSSSASGGSLQARPPLHTGHLPSLARGGRCVGHCE